MLNQYERTKFMYSSIKQKQNKTKLDVLVKLCSLVLIKYMITVNLSEILKNNFGAFLDIW